MLFERSKLLRLKSSNFVSGGLLLCATCLSLDRQVTGAPLDDDMSLPARSAVVLEARREDGLEIELDRAEHTVRYLPRTAAVQRIVPIGRIFHGHQQPVHHPLARG